MKNASNSTPYVRGHNRRLLFRTTFIALALFVGLASCDRSCDTLPEFHLYSDSIRWDKKSDCAVTTVQCGERDSSIAGVKFRGGSSAGYGKHSYAVSFGDKMTFGTLPKAKHWVLNASYIDKSFMRHKISFDLFRQMHPANKAPQCNYVHVYENSVFKGLYILMERMDKQRPELHKGNKGAFISKEPPLFYLPADTPNRDSMYLESFEFPKKKKQPLQRSDLKHLEWLIFEADDATFKREIFRTVSMQSLIDWQLIVLFTNNGDGQLKNYFIYRTGEESEMRIALWDFDHTFGRESDGERNLLVRTVDEKRNPLYKRLIELNPNRFNEHMASRWRTLRRNVFTEANVNRLIAENNRILAPYIAGNAKVWPITDREFYYDSDTYSDELQLIRKYVRLRIAQLDKRFGR